MSAIHTLIEVLNRLPMDAEGRAAVDRLASAALEEFASLQKFRRETLERKSDDCPYCNGAFPCPYHDPGGIGNP